MKRLRHRVTGAIMGYNAIMATHKDVVVFEDIEGEVVKDAPVALPRNTKKKPTTILSDTPITEVSDTAIPEE